MVIERVNGHGRMSELKAVPGARPAPETPPEAGDALEIGGEPEPDETIVRPAKVAAARLKILNDYYSRRDIQRALAERLVLELGE